MNEIEGLLKAYERFLQLPWDRTLAGPQKVWFAIYDPSQERRLRLRLAEFEVATRNAGHSWFHLDLTDLFATWMAKHDYHEAYFEEPGDMDLALQDFASFVSQQIVDALIAPGVDTNTVVAVSGLAACRRERTSSHASHSGSACVAHGADKSTRTERGRSQSWVGDGDRMGWKDATVPALGPG